MNRGQFITTTGGLVAATTVPGVAAIKPRYIRGGGGIDITPQQLQANGLGAVIDHRGHWIANPYSKDYAWLSSYAQRTASQVLGYEPGGDNCLDPGADCGGYPVIGTVVANNIGTGSFAGAAGGNGYFNNVVYLRVGINGPGYYLSPIYVYQRALSCAGNSFNEVTGDIRNVAAAIVGGFMGSQLGQLVISSARGYIAGTVSELGFLDVLVATTSCGMLAQVLAGAVAGLTIGIAIDWLWCMV